MLKTKVIDQIFKDPTLQSITVLNNSMINQDKN